MLVRIREAREKAGLKQTELADLIGVENVLISRWEREKVKPNIDNIKKIAKALNTTTDYLLGEKDEDISPEVGNDEIRYQKIDSDSRDFSFTEKLIDSNKMIVYENGNGRFFIPATSEGFDFIKEISKGNLAVAR